MKDISRGHSQAFSSESDVLGGETAVVFTGTDVMVVQPLHSSGEKIV